MKFLVKFLVLFVFLLGNSVNAETFKVLVLPVDLFSVCENYYCFQESSEIFANDVIDSFFKNRKIETLSLNDVRKKINETSQIKGPIFTALNKYKNTNTIDFSALKKVANDFNVNSVLLISSSINQQSVKRNIWEVLEVISAFKAYNAYTLETNSVLIDNVNDVVMWSAKYKKNLGDNEARFWARSTTEASSQLEKIRLYSKEIISPNISENVTLRFYPRTLVTDISNPLSQTKTKDFRPNAFEGMNNKLQENREFEDIESEAIFTF